MFHYHHRDSLNHFTITVYAHTRQLLRGTAISLAAYHFENLDAIGHHVLVLGVGWRYLNENWLHLLTTSILHTPSFPFCFSHHLLIPFGHKLCPLLAAYKNLCRHQCRQSPSSPACPWAWAYHSEGKNMAQGNNCCQQLAAGRVRCGRGTRSEAQRVLTAAPWGLRPGSRSCRWKWPRFLEPGGLF